MSIKTIKEANVVAAANAVRDTTQISNVVNTRLKAGKENLADLLDDEFAGSLIPVNGQLDIISNFKVECAEVIEIEDDNGEKTTTVIGGTGQIIQVQMRMGSDEIPDEIANKLRFDLGGKLFEKIFEERCIFETIDDFKKFFDSLSEDVLKSAAKVTNKGGFELKLDEAPRGLSGVTEAVAVFPKSGFLDKVSALPVDIREKVWPTLKDLIIDRVKPTIVVGNRPEEDSDKKTKKGK